MPPSNHQEKVLYDTMRILLNSLEQKIDLIITTRKLVKDNLYEKYQADILLNLFQTEDDLRDTCQLLYKCMSLHKQIEGISIYEKDIASFKLNNKEEHAHCCFSCSNSHKEINFDLCNSHQKRTIIPIPISLTSLTNHKNLNPTYDNNPNAIANKKPLLYFNYKSNQEIDRILHDEIKSKTINKDNTNHTSTSPNINLSIIKQLTEQNDYKVFEKNELEKLTLIADEEIDNNHDYLNSRNNDFQSPLNPDFQNSLFLTFKANEYLTIESSRSIVKDDIVNLKPKQGSSNKKRISIDNNHNKEKSNTINIVNKKKHKSIKVSQLVSILKSNSNLFEMLSLLFETDNIIDLLCNSNTGDQVIDSIAIAMNEIEKLIKIDEQTKTTLAKPFKNNTHIPLNNAKSKNSTNGKRKGLF